MFSERFYNQFRDDSGFRAREAMNALWVLIGINLFCFAVSDFGAAFDQNLAGAFRSPRLARMMLFTSKERFEVWQVLTYMFFHGSFTHILFNMYGLYLFGSLTAPILGRTRFLLLYFISGLTGAAFWLAANWGSPHPALGASGALFGVMVSVAMLRPNQEFFLFFVPVPVKAKTLIVVYALLELVSQQRGFATGVAHLAHLGGFVGGYLYLRFFCRREVVWTLGDLFAPRGPRPWRPSGSASAPRPEPRREEAPHGPITHVSQKEVDRLLDKISRDGINSLSDYERAELQFFRERMRGSGR